MSKTFTVEEWETIFKPIVNHFDPNASWGDGAGSGIMFETYGQELAFVQSQPDEKVWTYADSDNGTVICSGYWIANRIGYFVTEVGRMAELDDPTDHICITVSTDDEFEEEN